MLSRLWSHLQSRRHSHKHTSKHVDSALSMNTRYPHPVPLPLPVGVNIPEQCPLCDKKCALATPRCKHGTAFVQFLHTSPLGECHA